MRSGRRSIWSASWPAGRCSLPIGRRSAPNRVARCVARCATRAGAWRADAGVVIGTTRQDPDIGAVGRPDLDRPGALSASITRDTSAQSVRLQHLLALTTRHSVRPYLRFFLRPRAVICMTPRLMLLVAILPATSTCALRIPIRSRPFNSTCGSAAHPTSSQRAARAWPSRTARCTTCRPRSGARGTATTSAMRTWRSGASRNSGDMFNLGVLLGSTMHRISTVKVQGKGDAHGAGRVTLHAQRQRRHFHHRRDRRHRRAHHGDDHVRCLRRSRSRTTGRELHDCRLGDCGVRSGRDVDRQVELLEALNLFLHPRRAPSELLARDAFHLQNRLVAGIAGRAQAGAAQARCLRASAPSRCGRLRRSARRRSGR